MTANISSLSKGLVAHYPLNGESETKDITPNANHGTNNGATLSTGRKGEQNGSYSFDGNDKIITSLTPYNIHSSNTGDISMSIWISQSAIGGVFGANDSNDNRFYLIKRNATNLGVGFGTWKVDYIFTQQSWNNIIIILSEGTGKIYINGALIDIAINKVFDHVNKILNIGNIENSHPFNGSISDFRIYNRALEEDEIKLLYDSFKPEIATSDLNKGLVGHWMLDSENGAKDLTPNGNHGTANGGITVGGDTDRKGKSNGATTFDGVDDYIKGNSNLGISGNAELTMSAWIYWDNTIWSSNYPSAMGNNSTSTPNQGLSMTFYNGRPALDFWDKRWSATNSLNVKTWYHIVATKTPGLIGNTSKIYVNGIEVSGAVEGANSTPNIIDSNPIIGRLDDARWFKGKIADARIYNRVLSTDEIKLLYDQYKPKEASIGSLNKGLVLDMPLTTKHMKSSTVVADRTPYGNDGTVSGATVGSQYTSFDGVDDDIIINELNTTKSYSIWVNPSLLNSVSQVIFTNVQTNIGLGFNLGTHLIVISGDGTIVRKRPILPQGFSINNWYHIVVNYDENLEPTCYINGLETAYGSTNWWFESNTPYMFIGRRNSGSPFYGKLANFRVYDRNLSEEEIKLLYEKGRY